MLALGCLAAGAAHAATATVEVLHAFDDGANPHGALVQGSDGSFYGTTQGGGTSGNGTLFRITPAGVLTTLHSFSGSDGRGPIAGLSFGSDGNFYGTTERGGTNDRGTVFQMSPSGTLTTLFHFDDANGAFPRSAPLLASDGKLYGVAGQGGSAGYGTVYRINSPGLASTLFSFDVTRGQNPHGALISGADGNLYGTTEGGGTSGGHGTVFRISTSGTLVSLSSFDYANRGAAPEAALFLASDGNYYGSTQGGGASGAGTLFKMTSAGVVTNLLSFGGANGAGPRCALVPGTDGNLYGTTAETLFRVTPGGSLTTLFQFSGATAGSPHAGLVRGADGNFYGTTRDGGAAGKGTVFRMLPPPGPPSGLSATASGDGIALSWSPSATAASYKVYQGTASGEQADTPVKTGVAATSVAIEGLSSGTYYFTVTAVSASGESSASNEASATVNLPDDYSFAPVTGASPGTPQQSGLVTISGLLSGTSVPVTVAGDSGAAYSLNGAAFTSEAGSVSNGMTLRLRVDASPSANTTTQATVSTGRVSRSFSVTTATPDATPDPFSFAPVTDAYPQSPQTSGTVVVSGINVAVPISVSGAAGATYSVNGGAFTASAGTLGNGSSVRVRLAAPAAFGSTASATLDIGGVTASFSVTTRADDVPDAFAFDRRENVPAGSEQVSEAVVIAGIATPAQITIEGSEAAAYSINGGAFASAAGTVRAGDSVRVKVNASMTPEALSQAILTIGGVTGTFAVVTAPAPAETAGALDRFLLAVLLTLGMRRARRRAGNVL